MSRLVVLLVLLAVALSAPAAAQPAKATAHDRARKLYDEAMELYRAEQYRQAINRLAAAQVLRDHENHLYHLSRCYQKLGQMRQAYDYSRKYVRHLPAARQQGTLRLAEKKLRWDPLCKVSISSAPSGATVLVDGKPRGETGGKALVLSLRGGERKVEVRLDGYSSDQWAPTLEFGEPRSRRFDLQARRATLRVRSNVPGARISLVGFGQAPDGTEKTEHLGVAPLQRQLMAGHHLVQADAAGYKPTRKWVTLPPGKTTELLFTFEANHKVPAPPAEAPSPAAGDSVFFDVLFGPANVDYGDDAKVPAGWSVELSAGGGYLWRLGRWGLYTRGSLHYAPSMDLVNSASSGAFVMGLAGGGGRYYLRRWLWIDGSASLGLSLLVGASRESALFGRKWSRAPDQNDEDPPTYEEKPIVHKGVGFGSLALRGRVGVGLTMGPGITVAAYPFALDFCTRHSDFRDGVSGILRYNVALAVGWQL